MFPTYMQEIHKLVALSVKLKEFNAELLLRCQLLCAVSAFLFILHGYEKSVAGNCLQEANSKT